MPFRKSPVNTCKLGPDACINRGRSVFQLLKFSGKKWRIGSLNGLPHIGPNARLLLQRLLPQNITTDVTSKKTGSTAKHHPYTYSRRGLKVLLLLFTKFPNPTCFSCWLSDGPMLRRATVRKKGEAVLVVSRSSLRRFIH